MLLDQGKKLKLWEEKSQMGVSYVSFYLKVALPLL